MKILTVAFAYNERKYIPEMVNYYRSQGTDLFILDNHSTDGTREWLMTNGVNTRVQPTDGQFQLKWLQKGLVNEIHAQKPDWVVYAGIDLYFVFDKTIRETIEEAESEGFNMIGVKYFNLYNTGEIRNDGFVSTYYYGRDLKKLYMIAKYSIPFNFEADSIQIKEKKIKVVNGIVVNYGNCKPAAERENTFKRRQKAWDRGLDRNYGVHYLEGHEKHWIWNKDELIDLRTTEYGKYLEKLGNDCTNNPNRSKS